MSTDLEMLVWTTGLTALMWLPYIVAHILNVGLVPALTYQADNTPLPDWAARAKKAHYNAIENLAPFAVLVIVAHLTQTANDATAAAAIAFFWARLAHYFLYMAAVPFGRTITFVIGWAAILCIFWQIVF
ncbi:MAG: MAPEG family protein [Alphaproteobacteria bacterium]